MNDSCTEPALAAFIMIFKNIMAIFQIIVPILLIISAIISLGTLVMFPDDPDVKGPPHRPNRIVPRVLIHKVVAAIVIFFLPAIINLTISVAAEAMEDDNPNKDFSFTKCWNAASNGEGIIQWVPGGEDISQ